MISPAVLDVPFAPLQLSDPWHVPEGCPIAGLVSAIDGSTPRLPSTVSLWHDRACLYALFLCADRGAVATYTRRDEPLWQEDAVEIFLSPGPRERYFEIEVNPLATIFDASVHSPLGTRERMEVDTSWDCEGLWAAVRRVIRPHHEERWDTLVAIPFSSLGVSPPSPRETWRGNFYRIDRGETDEFTAWRATGRQPADFHVASSFGELRFV